MTSALAGRPYLKMNGLGNSITVLDLRGTGLAVSADYSLLVLSDLSLENPGSRMSRLGRTEISEAEPLTVTQLLRRFDDVTLRDAREAAERVLTRPLALTVLGPFSKGAVA